MRKEKTEQILKLAQMMQASAEGVCLKDIEQAFGVHRRTAERMRDAVVGVFPEIEEFTYGDKIKRWRMRSSSLMQLSNVSVDELADLQTAIELMKNQNLSPQAERLGDLLAKIKGAINQPKLFSMETDLEALLEGEGYATRPGPKLKINNEVLSEIREAIKGSYKIKITYANRHKDKVSTRNVAPYGILYGKRHYLIAWEDTKKQVQKFILANISNIESTTKYFDKGDFDLHKYAEQSFGVFTDETMNVKWKFPPELAEDIKDHIFHPTETREVLEDGSTIVSFTAGGWQEMCWHLFTWGGCEKIIEPKWLKDRYIELLESAIKGQG